MTWANIRLQGKTLPFVLHKYICCWGLCQCTMHQLRYSILQAGASVNAQCFNGSTALHIACGRQNLGMVALLLAAGADKTIENSEEVRRDDSEDSGSDEDQGQRDARSKVTTVSKDTASPSRRGHLPQDYVQDNDKVCILCYWLPN